VGYEIWDFELKFKYLNKKPRLTMKSTAACFQTEENVHPFLFSSLVSDGNIHAQIYQGMKQRQI